MVRLRSKYLRSILALSIGALLVLSIWAFWESRRAAQLEDALREVRMELGRVQLEAARNQVPVRSAALPESEYTVPDSAARMGVPVAADISSPECSSHP